MLYNQTKKKKITTDVVFCKNMLSQGSGLMFRTKNSVEDKAWVFVFKKSRQVSLTMFCVFFPIDVLFLDSKKKIIEVKENFKSFGYYNAKTNAKYVIELEKGTIKDKKIKINNVLKF